MTKTLTYDQLTPGKRYRATVEVMPNGSGGFCFFGWPDATYEEIPEPPKPLAVGDLVNSDFDSGTVKAIISDKAWVAFHDGDETVIPLSDLTRIEGEG